MYIHIDNNLSDGGCLFCISSTPICSSVLGRKSRGEEVIVFVMLIYVSDMVKDCDLVRSTTAEDDAETMFMKKNSD